MKKVLCLWLCFMMLFTGCKTKDKLVSDLSSQEETNPFDLSGEDGQTVMASFGFCVDAINENKTSMDYKGGEMEFDCTLTNSEIPCEVGINIFVNGLSQPFKTQENSEEKTVQAYSLKENEKKKVRVKFTPVIGKKGDKLDVTCGTILYPSFKPTKDTNTIMPNLQYMESWPWHINCLADGGTLTPNISTDYKFVDISNENKEKYFPRDENGNLRMLDVNDGIKIKLQTEDKLSRVDISGGKKTITLEALCANKYTYRVSFYINHKLVPVFDGKEYLDIKPVKDKLLVKDIVLDPQKLDIDKYNHTYLMVVPLAINDEITAPSPIMAEGVVLIKEKS